MSRAKEPVIVYFSSVTENTKHFVEKLTFKNKRIPLRRNDAPISTDGEQYVLVVPTYGSGDPKTAVPKQVIKFLNVPENRAGCIGVIGAGNMNFGEDYCIAADIISWKLQNPVLYRFELRGMPEDVEKVQQGIEEFYEKLCEESVN